METTYQYWFIVTTDEYDEFDHELRTRKIFPRSANELNEHEICVYFEATEEEWQSLLYDWGAKYAA